MNGEVGYESLDSEESGKCEDCEVTHRFVHKLEAHIRKVLGKSILPVVL
jgi:hypothetical protein